MVCKWKITCVKACGVNGTIVFCAIYTEKCVYSVWCKRRRFCIPCGVNGEVGLNHQVEKLLKILLIRAVEAEQFCYTCSEKTDVNLCIPGSDMGKVCCVHAL